MELTIIHDWWRSTIDREVKCDLFLYIYRCNLSVQIVYFLYISTRFLRIRILSTFICLS